MLWTPVLPDPCRLVYLSLATVDGFDARQRWRAGAEANRGMLQDRNTAT